MALARSFECLFCGVLIVLFLIYILGANWLFGSLCYAVIFYALFSLTVILFDVDGVFWQQAVEAAGLSLLILYLLFFVCS
ncbi:hypothetical protein [Macrococcus lamae]|uniref:Uncharacterized protein n=1 Tax=Macrococcus lamae TaxID=198484 RepID=A0A4V3BEW6_9STAP|nr:hypothetical protein [Macrococcus lamae]TDM10567.1 hypothetical protein ERX29_06895 [Macrococcus lamae]